MTALDLMKLQLILTWNTCFVFTLQYSQYVKFLSASNRVLTALPPLISCSQITKCCNKSV